MAMLFCILVYGIGSAVYAQDKDDANEKLKQIEQEITDSKRQQDILAQQARRAETAASALSTKLIAAAKEIQVTEGNASRLELRIDTLETEQDAKQSDLLANNKNIVELIAALERLSKRPAILTLLKPDEAISTARSATIMASLVPLVDAKATSLKRDLEALNAIQKDLADERFKLKNSLQKLTENQQTLASLLAQRRAEAEQASSRARALSNELRSYAQEAQTLRELVAKLEQQSANARRTTSRRGTTVARNIPRGSGEGLRALRGQLPYPAVGPVVKRFGAADGAGKSRGIRIRARKNAQIIAPYDGRVVFAGPFRDYGLLLIIDHGDGYHSLLAGFDKMQGTVGQWVLMGEPIGVMQDTKVSEDLYLELRHNGNAINPAPWLKRDTASAR
ncbi:murein hydrolase activator EnvC family protein [Kordiimonas aquimaris]|uniref:murein hydrolase activator EnvC family protein n=1 Tax=Kordiimonas aquimaris TaxID=707591 RepID=UPI0021D01A71|nr:peptidoglycan DD-metalloendopeptidase family protein [Kordiimonas aquimaris]